MHLYFENVITTDSTTAGIEPAREWGIVRQMQDHLEHYISRGRDAMSAYKKLVARYLPRALKKYRLELFDAGDKVKLTLEDLLWFRTAYRSVSLADKKYMVLSPPRSILPPPDRDPCDVPRTTSCPFEETIPYPKKKDVLAMGPEDKLEYIDGKVANCN